MIKRLLLILALLASANAAEIRPAGGAINRARINYAATFDADAQTYFTAVTANGGTMSAATKAAVNAFVLSAKANGYWTKLTRINLFCGDQLAAALVPLKVGGGNATDTNTNFVSGDYSEVTGLTAGTGDEFLNTGLLANALSANDTHLSVYNRGSSAVGGNIAIGASATTALYAPFLDGSAYSVQYANGAGQVGGAITGPFGLVLGSRTSATSHVIYKNGSSVASNATSGGTLATVALFVFANNNAGAADAFTSHNFGSYSIGSGLTGANVTSYNTDLEVFQDAMGRGVQ